MPYEAVYSLPKLIHGFFVIIFTMQVILLAAGKGRRLEPLTKIMSKPMAPILNVPILKRIFDSFYVAGIRDFIIVKSQEDEKIEEYFDRHAPTDSKIKFVDQIIVNGSAGAVTMAEQLVNDNFIVSAGDSLMEDSFIEKFVSYCKTNNPEAVVASLVSTLDKITKSSNIVLSNDRKVIAIKEKPLREEIVTELLGLPLYYFKKRYIKYLCEIKESVRGEKEIQDALNKIIKENGHIDNVNAEKRHDLTNIEDFYNLNMLFLKMIHSDEIYQDFNGEKNNILTQQPVCFGENIKVGNGSTIGPNAVIGDNVIIGENCRIQDSIVMEGAHIEDNIVIEKEIIFN